MLCKLYHSKRFRNWKPKKMTQEEEIKKTDEPISDTDAKEKTPIAAGEPSAKKKRTAGRQITKDDGDDSDSSTEVLKPGSFQKAAPEILKKRRILRARVPTGNVESHKSTTIPTAAADEADEKKEKEGAEKEKECTEKSADDVNEIGEGKDDAAKDSTSEEKTNTSNPFAAVTFSSAVGTNPFAAAFSKPKTGADSEAPSTGFGSFASGSTGFGSTFGSTSGFGSNKTDPKKPLFGSSSSGMLFGQSTNSGFGSSTGFASASTTTKIGSNTSSFFNSKSSATTPFGLSNTHKKEDSISGSKNDEDQTTDKEQEESLALSNGEEGFESIFQTRAKLFKRMPVEEKKEQTDKNTTAASQSVPPSASSNITSQSVPSTSNGSKSGENTGENGADNNHDKNKSNAIKMDWKEVGIGPLKILKSTEDNIENDNGSSTKKAEDFSGNEPATNTSLNKLRLVQRRGSTAGGHGTKLILNLSLRPECQVNRQAEKYVRLAAFEVENGITMDQQKTNCDEKQTDEHKIIPVNYLFRVKTIAEADDLENALKDAIKACS